jgi:uncharacterized membrane protein
MRIFRRPPYPGCRVDLLGLSAGNVLYAGRSPAKTTADFPMPRPRGGSTSSEGKTLPIYLLHQPALGAALWALEAIRPGVF